MAVKTIYQITHSCGHIAERDPGGPTITRGSPAG
jgi:hypothetical protein